MNNQSIRYHNKGNCIDCHLPCDSRAKRCKSCAVKGELNPNYKHGLPKCKDCGKELWKGSVRCASCARKGKLHPNWNGGIGQEGYSFHFNFLLKEKIRNRDNRTCQKCFELGKYVHHIDYNKQNCKETNLINLCHKCNIKANYNRDYWFAYFTYKIKEIYGR